MQCPPFERDITRVDLFCTSLLLPKEFLDLVNSIKEVTELVTDLCIDIIGVRLGNLLDALAFLLVLLYFSLAGWLVFVLALECLFKIVQNFLDLASRALNVFVKSATFLDRANRRAGKCK